MVASISKADWENYRAVGRVPPSIREVVLQSWQRSSHIRATVLKHAPKLAEEEFHSTRTASRRFRLGAKAALAKADYLLQQTGNMLLLCDRAGIVLDAAGDRETLARGRENHLHLGGRWHEDAVGTNAIGTAIHLGRSVQVSGPEHYSEEIQRWSCAASPVTDPGTGRMLGVLDISWPDGVEQPGYSILSSVWALQIESELSRQLAQDRQLLLDQLNRGRLTDPFLLMDRTGADVFASSDFARLLDNPERLATLRAMIPDLIDAGTESMTEALAEIIPHADLRVIEGRDDSIGVMLSLCGRRKRRSAGIDLARISALGEEMLHIAGQGRRLLQTSLPILIEGETGTGKATLARALHRESEQSGGPFEVIDCAILTPDSLREDLADGRMPVSGGILCLDRPSAAPLTVQKMLLGVIDMAAHADSRVIAISSRPLYAAMQEGTLRSDLYYRIAGARLALPPLREQSADIPTYLREIASRHARETGARELRFTPAAMNVLRDYSWPGNLREMQNLVASLAALSPSPLIDERNLPPEIRRPVAASGDETLRDVEKTEILATIEAAEGNMTEAARRLGIARSTLYLKLDAYGIPRSRKC